MAVAVVLAGLVAFAVLAVAATVAVLATLFHLLVRLVLLPLLLIKWIVGAAIMLIVGPVLFVVALAGVIAATLALAIPLLPVIVVGAIVWAVVRPGRRPAAA